MLAARLYGPRDIRIDQISEPPPPGPGQVRVKVTAVGICNSKTRFRAISRSARRRAHSP